MKRNKLIILVVSFISIFSVIAFFCSCEKNEIIIEDMNEVSSEIISFANIEEYNSDL